MGLYAVVHDEVLLLWCIVIGDVEVLLLFFQFYIESYLNIIGH